MQGLLEKRCTGDLRDPTVDADGRVASRPLASSGQVTAYTWTTFDKLGMASVNGTVQEMDGYSADGLRNVKSNGTMYTNSEGLPLCETRSSGPVSFVRSGGILGIDPGGTGAPYFYLTDHLGSVRQTVNASGTVQTATIFNEFGLQTPIANPGTYTDRSLAFVGGLGVRNEPTTPANQPTGSNNGLQLMGQRWYDPNLAIFRCRDPIGLEGGPNLYGYVGANPTNFVDPMGLAPTFSGSSSGLLSTAYNVFTQTAYGSGDPRLTQVANFSGSANIDISFGNLPGTRNADTSIDSNGVVHIVINNNFLQGGLTNWQLALLMAALLAHELTHAKQFNTDPCTHGKPSRSSLQRLEKDAYRNEALLASNLFGPSPFSSVQPSSPFVSQALADELRNMQALYGTGGYGQSWANYVNTRVP